MTSPIKAASALIGILLLTAASAGAQVVELSGGTSSLYEAQGAGLSVRAANYESGVSAGSVAGRFVVGAHATYHTPRAIYSLGIEELRLNLPTDLFGVDHRMLGVGAGVRATRGEGDDATTVEAFAGTSSDRFDTPLFQGALLEKPAGVLVVRTPLSDTVTWTVQATHVNTTSVLQSLQWKPSRGFALAETNGFVGNSLYSAASVSYKGPQLDLAAAYITLAAKAQRPGSETDMAPEPIRENVQVTLRSSSLAKYTVSFGRQNALVPVSTIGTAPGLISTVDQVSGTARIARVGLSATALHSTYDGRSDVATMISASRTVGPRLQVQSMYLASRLTDALGVHPATQAAVTTLQETVNRRLSVNETITRSNGQTSVAFGGSLLSNLATVSADYQTFYVPTRPDRPFQQTLVLDVQLHLLGRMTLHGATFVGPDGKMLYTTDVKTVGALTQAARPTVMRTNFGVYMLAGRVVDVDGSPISGATIEVSGMVLVTNSEGEFFLRERKAAAHGYRILLDEFLDGRSYEVVSKPELLMSGRQGGAAAVIVLTRAEHTALGGTQ